MRLLRNLSVLSLTDSGIIQNNREQFNWFRASYDKFLSLFRFILLKPPLIMRSRPFPVDFSFVLCCFSLPLDRQDRAGRGRHESAECCEQRRSDASGLGRSTSASVHAIFNTFFAASELDRPNLFSSRLMIVLFLFFQPLLQFSLKQLLVWQIQFVLCCVNICIHRKR